jgi:hypothetical protein
MPDDGDGVIFIGGKDYLSLFCRMTAHFHGATTAFFNAAQPPSLPAGFRALRFQRGIPMNPN